MTWFAKLACYPMILLWSIFGFTFCLSTFCSIYCSTCGFGPFSVLFWRRCMKDGKRSLDNQGFTMILFCFATVFDCLARLKQWQTERYKQCEFNKQDCNWPYSNLTLNQTHAPWNKNNKRTKYFAAVLKDCGARFRSAQVQDYCLRVIHLCSLPLSRGFVSLCSR